MGSSKFDKFQAEHIDSASQEAFESMFFRGGNPSSQEDATKAPENMPDTKNVPEEKEETAPMPPVGRPKKKVPTGVIPPRGENAKGKTRNYKKNQELVRIQSYLTKELYEALEYKAYIDPSENKSGHVRAALEAYLAKEIRTIRNAGGRS